MGTPKPIANPPPAAQRRPSASPETPAPAPQSALSAPPPGEVSADRASAEQVASALRGALGCNRNALIKLSPEEKATCDERMAGVAGAQAPPSPLGLGPEAKAAFDLAVRENKSVHIPLVGCFATFEPGKIHWYHPSRGVKLGPLPCYVVAPKGVLLPDKEKAKGFF